MKWKLSVSMVLTGLCLAVIFYWGNHIYGASAVGEQLVGTMALGASSITTGEPEEEERSTAEEAPPSPESLFSACTYYHAGYLDRYIQYQQRAPELDMETVVWHVNAGLDLPPYASASEAEGNHPLLVNKQHRLPEGYEPPELVEIHSKIMATPGAAEAFRLMRAAAMSEGVFIEASGGYRSLERQQQLFEEQELYYGTEAAEAAVARPGFGEHSTGRALHIVDRNYTFEGFEALPEYAWLMEHCADYGFILRYGEGLSHITGFDYEPYHFTFVGRETALYMREWGIQTLEEYAARGLADTDNTPIDDRTTVVILTGEESGYEAALALRIKDYLEAETMRVVVTQDSGVVEKEAKAAALVGVGHTGAGGAAVAWFDSESPESRALAETVCARLSWSGLGGESRGVYEDDKIDLLRLNGAPAVYIELSDTHGPANGEANEKLAKSISHAITAHLGVRKLYLTFDDGPSGKNTPKVLDILNEKGVKATFFVIGEMAETNPELLRRIAAEGHAIGIHCYKHDYKELYASPESFLEDFNKARKAVGEITGQEPVIYRFPGGSVNEHNQAVYAQIIAEMESRGFVHYDWNISADDSFGSVKAGELMNNIKAYPRSRYAILLMHDAYAGIAGELDAVINHFSDYQMNVIDGDTAPIQF